MQRKRHNRRNHAPRGLSDVITTVLIIVLSLVAVAIVGSVVMKQVQNSGMKMYASQACQAVEVKPVKCEVGGGQYTVTVTREGGDPKVVVNSVGLIFSKGGVSKKVDGTVGGFVEGLDVYATKDYSGNLDSSVNPPEKVKAVAYITVADENVDNYPCPVVSAEVDCTESVPPENILPSVTLSVPYSTLIEGTSQTINVTAKDTDGIIAEIKLIDNGVDYPGGSCTGGSGDSTLECDFEWFNYNPGQHNLTAVATDDDDSQANSNPFTVTVVPVCSAGVTYNLTVRAPSDSRVWDVLDVNAHIGIRYNDNDDDASCIQYSSTALLPSNVNVPCKSWVNVSLTTDDSCDILMGLPGSIRWGYDADQESCTIESTCSLNMNSDKEVGLKVD